MMRGFIVIVTAAMAMIFLGKKQYAHHFISMILITGGVTMVGAFNIIYSEDKKDGGESKSTPTKPLGIILLLIAQLFTGGQFITEEKLLSGYYLDPFYAVGLEGMFGCIVFAIILPIMQYVDCGTGDMWDQLCTNGHLEDTPKAFSDMGYNSNILIESIGIIISIACFNACGVAVTKYASAPQRSTVDTCRTLFIWVISMMLGFESFIWQELLGFFLLVLGTLIYNEIIVIPISFMKFNTKVEMAKRNRMSEGEYTDDAAYLSTSPGAMYNQGARNNQQLNK